MTDYSATAWATALFGDARGDVRNQLRVAAGAQPLALVTDIGALDSLMLADVATCALAAKRQGWHEPPAPQSWAQAKLNFQMMIGPGGGGNAGGSGDGGTRSDGHGLRPAWLSSLPPGSTTSVGKATKEEMEAGYALSSAALKPLEQESFVTSEVPHVNSALHPLVEARRLVALRSPAWGAWHAQMMSECGCGSRPGTS